MIDRPDPLDAPLGRARDAAERREATRDAGRWGWAAAGLGLAGFVAVVAMTEPKAPGGRPQAVAQIEKVAPPPAAPPATPVAAPAAAASAVTGTGPSITQIEAASGVRINRPAGMTAPGALIIQVPPPGGGASPMLALDPAPDPRLVEKTPQGAIPKIASDGARASEVYARPVILGAALKPGAPRLALYVDGVGLAPGPTQTAIGLPAAITLAFAAIGEGLPKQAAAARDAGHEILLQAPMEPPDYPANDPGPDTLLASDPARNLTRLHAMMARFPGYVGLANYLGGRFLADEPALTPVLRDIAARGLFYVEDVAGERSLASGLAGRLGLTVLRADVVVDRGDGDEAVKSSLDRLEALARERGAAIGAASALPGAMAQIKRWAEGLEGRGVALVPLSSMAATVPAPRVSGGPQRKK